MIAKLRLRLSKQTISSARNVPRCREFPALVYPIRSVRALHSAEQRDDVIDRLQGDYSILDSAISRC